MKQITINKINDISRLLYMTNIKHEIYLNSNLISFKSKSITVHFFNNSNVFHIYQCKEIDNKVKQFEHKFNRFNKFKKRLIELIE